jgi:hypothetical protein
MLGSLMLDRISGEVVCVDVIIADQCSMTKRAPKFLQKLAQTASLSDTVSDSSIFRLCAGSGYHSLMLG